MLCLARRELLITNDIRISTIKDKTSLHCYYVQHLRNFGHRQSINKHYYLSNVYIINPKEQGIEQELIFVNTMIYCCSKNQVIYSQTRTARRVNTVGWPWGRKSPAITTADVVSPLQCHRMTTTEVVVYDNLRHSLSSSLYIYLYIVHVYIYIFLYLSMRSLVRDNSV